MNKLINKKELAKLQHSINNINSELCDMQSRFQTGSPTMDHIAIMDNRLVSDLLGCYNIIVKLKEI